LNHMNGDILSCIVHTRPGTGAEVATVLGALDGVEVHSGTDVDKLVVTIEDTAQTLAADRLASLNDYDVVINTTLIYHYGGDDLDRPQQVAAGADAQPATETQASGGTARDHHSA
jgi:nitrate reductase NapD